MKKPINLQTKAQRRRGYQLTNRLLAGPKPKPVNVEGLQVQFCEDAVARGANYLHRKTARALPMRGWVREF
jgi:hypothetical protein